jgi:hypothetical protein
MWFFCEASPAYPIILQALEDPHVTLETLAPYVLTSHVRDSAV